MAETASPSEAADQSCDLEHVRPDMDKRILLIFISGIAIGVILASLALGALISCHY